MKKEVVYHSSILLVVLAIIGYYLLSCAPSKEVLLSPPDKKAVYSVPVEDATEIALLQQQLSLPIVNVINKRVYYTDEQNAFQGRLKELGYDQIQQEDLLQVYKKYVMLKFPKKDDSAALKSLQRKLQADAITVINKEKDHWVIYGTLASLGKFQKQGYTFQDLNYEVRPRVVEITVNRTEDVQKVSDLGVDIFSSEYSRSDQKIIIHGSAYDHQIESVGALNFTVKIVRPRL